MSEEPETEGPAVRRFVSGDLMVEIPDQVQVHYLKTNLFRTIFASGAIGGMSGVSHISMCLFHERGPIPRSITHHVTEDGKLGDEIVRDSREGVIREIDTEVVMDIETAQELANWLQKKVKEAGIRQGLVAAATRQGQDAAAAGEPDTHLASDSDSETAR